ncbi:copper resistance D family protein [Saccharothrix variisporea]|uniref:Copper transport protein n=1 Tax=Saccharothrix variisporea TaxID=543527 RepID=A0A495XCC7_9PSEU|nr:CopD family protein [Saccharothrix variisporea]RKT71647.1 copper transport protein [Saccharothrix variisporea]
MNLALAVDPARSWLTLARLVDYTGTVLFLGGTAFLAFLWPDGAGERRPKRLLVVAWLLGAVGTVAGLVLTAAWIARTAPQDVTTGTVRAVLDIPFGRAWTARALLWVLAGVVLVDLLRRGRAAATSLPWRVGAGAIAFGVLRTSGMTGHAPDLGWWAQAAVLVHLVAVSLWVGGLAVLLTGVLPGRDPDTLRRVVPRYSTLALGSVTVLTAAGALLAWRLNGFQVATDYARILVVKLSLFGVLLAAGLFSKRWVDRRLATATTVAPFARSVALETVLAIAVLGAAAFLVTASPGR